MKSFLKSNFICLTFLLSTLLSVNAQVINMHNGVEDQIGIEPITFYDPGGVNPFGTNIRDTLVMYTNVEVDDPNQVIYVRFEDFAIGFGDALYIYDGQGVTSDLIGIYNSVSSPGVIFSTGKYLTFVFIADDIDDIGGMNEGWNARVQSYNLNPTDVYMTSNIKRVTTCNTTFYDSGGPTGSINGSQNKKYAFISELGTHIRIEFAPGFDIGTSGRMDIYDGDALYDETTRKIGSFNNVDPPPVLFSTANQLTIHFVGTGGTGWMANVTCVDALFEPPADGTACPQVNINRVLNGASSPVSAITFACDTPIIMLEAELMATGRYTNDYKVYSIPYNPPFPFNSGTVLAITTDDAWGNSVQLPFTFSFFGQRYTSVYPGSNGLISMSPRNGFCAYQYLASNPVRYNYTNCIYGVYEDIDPRYFWAGGAIKRDVMGTYPCRAFVFNYLDVGLYGHHSSYSNYNTYQMVLYEGTNIIEVHIRHRDCCATTNPNGEGVVGVQNRSSSPNAVTTGTDNISGPQEVIAPNRGMTTPTGAINNWTSDNESWRFVPVTPLDEEGTLTWYINSIADSNIIGTSKKMPVSPTRTSRYIVEYNFTNASDSSFSVRDTVNITVNIPPIVAGNTANGKICPGDTVTCTVNNVTPDMAHFRWSTRPTEDTLSTLTVSPDSNTVYTVTVTYANSCTTVANTSISIKNLVYPIITGDTSICKGASTVLTTNADSVRSYKWSNAGTTRSITVTPHDTTTYSVTITLVNNCTTSNTFTVNVLPKPTAGFSPNPPLVYVENGLGPVEFVNFSSGASVWHWNFGDVSSMDNISTLETPTHNYTLPGNFIIRQNVENEYGCRDSTVGRVTVEVPFFFYVPNSFSPNGDGINEHFAPKGEGINAATYEMSIFDRYGNVIWRTKTPYDYWDGRTFVGKQCPLGTYVYIIRFYTLNGEAKEYTGSVSLIR